MTSSFCVLYSFCHSFCNSTTNSTAKSDKLTKISQSLAKGLVESAFTTDSNGATTPSHVDTPAASYISFLALAPAAFIFTKNLF